MNPNNPPFIPSLGEAAYHDTFNSLPYLAHLPLPSMPLDSIPIPMAEGQVGCSASTADMNSQDLYAAQFSYSMSSSHQTVESTTTPINMPPFTGCPVADVRWAPGPTNYTG
jgi:hypothetical protein